MAHASTVLGQVEVSADGETYTTVWDGGSDYIAARQTIVFASTSVRYLRWSVGGNTKEAEAAFTEIQALSRQTAPRECRFEERSAWPALKPLLAPQGITQCQQISAERPERSTHVFESLPKDSTNHSRSPVQVRRQRCDDGGAGGGDGRRRGHRGGAAADRHGLGAGGGVTALAGSVSAHAACRH